MFRSDPRFSPDREQIDVLEAVVKGTRAMRAPASSDVDEEAVRATFHGRR